MKLGRVFNLASTVSFLLLGPVLIVSGVTSTRLRGFEFQHSGARWEIASRGGRVWVSNGPQLQLEEQRDTPQLKQSTAGTESLPGRTRPVVHTLRLNMVAWLLAILPLLWIIRLILTRPLVRRETRTPVGAVSVAFLVISLVIGILWIRSELVSMEWVFATRPAAGPAMPSTAPMVWHTVGGVVVSGGCLQFYDTIYRLPASATFRPAGYRSWGKVARPTIPKRPGPEEDHRHWWAPGMVYDSRPNYANRRGLAFVGHRTLIIDLWLPLLICMVLPAVRIRYRIKELRRERRIANAQCPDCGYSTTGNVSGICPECGTEVAPATTPAH